jgi:hypothetical protein
MSMSYAMSMEAELLEMGIARGDMSQVSKYWQGWRSRLVISKD